MLNLLLHCPDKDLIKGVQDVLTKKDQKTKNCLLLLAAEGDRLNSVKHLIDAGADVNAHGDIGNTALLLSAREGNTAIVNSLLEKMSPQAINAKNNSGKTALHMHAYEGNTAIVNSLLEKMSPQAINAKDNYGQTALHAAIARPGNTAIVNSLLEKMSLQAINAKNRHGETVLTQMKSIIYMTPNPINAREVKTSIIAYLNVFGLEDRIDALVKEEYFQERPVTLIRCVKKLADKGYEFKPNRTVGMDIEALYSDHEKIEQFLAAESFQCKPLSNFAVIVEKGELEDVKTALEYKTHITHKERGQITAKHPEQATELLDKFKDEPHHAAQTAGVLAYAEDAISKMLGKRNSLTALLEMYDITPPHKKAKESKASGIKRSQDDGAGTPGR